MIDVFILERVGWWGIILRVLLASFPSFREIASARGGAQAGCASRNDDWRFIWRGAGLGASFGGAQDDNFF